MIRIVTNVEGSCKSPQLHCYKTAPDRERYGKNGTADSPMPSAIWQPLLHVPLYPYGAFENTYSVITVYNTSNNDTFAGAKGRGAAAQHNIDRRRVPQLMFLLAQPTTALLTKLQNEDTDFIGRYALFTQVEMLADHDAQLETDRYVQLQLHWWSEAVLPQVIWSSY